MLSHEIYILYIVRKKTMSQSGHINLKMLELRQKMGIEMVVHYRIMTGVTREFQSIAKDIRCLETQVL
jgi:hypothetical protein